MGIKKVREPGRNAYERVEMKALQFYQFQIGHSGGGRETREVLGMDPANDLKNFLSESYKRWLSKCVNKDKSTFQRGSSRTDPSNRASGVCGSSLFLLPTSPIRRLKAALTATGATRLCSGTPDTNGLSLSVVSKQPAWDGAVFEYNLWSTNEEEMPPPCDSATGSCRPGHAAMGVNYHPYRPSAREF